MKKSILHLTDLHLNNFHGTDEHLRKRFYKEYIDGLVLSIIESGNKVDYLVITGDFVDKGKTENFPYVTEIIKYMCHRLELKEKNVCVCIGNHDFKFKEETLDGKKSQEVRKPFSDFSTSYFGSIIERNERAYLKKLDDTTYFLSLDSTLGSHSEKLQGKPGNIADEEIDIIVNDFVKDNLQPNDILLIGCHYPIENFPNSLAGNSEENWSENHFWRQGGFLRSRINKIPGVTKVWFMGDTHFPDHLQYEDAIFLMTGRFGGTTKIDHVGSISHIPRQGKIISLESSNYSDLITYNFFCTTHEDSAHHGTWSFTNSPMRRIQDSKQLPGKAEKTKADSHPRDFYAIDLISETIEEQLISRIKELDLYSFGRFRTDSDHTSLGWISINQLLNEPQILSSIVSKSANRIETKISSDVSKTAIIGLDFWGAIIGSQVSVRTGIKHFCLASRGNGQYHSEYETNNDHLENQIKSLECIIIFIDVVSSGNTIRKLIDSFKTKHNNICYHFISVIANDTDNTKKLFPAVQSAGSFCVNLKIPIINNSEMPSESLLPPDIDFSIKEKE